MNGTPAANAILSDLTVHMKYARYLPEKKRRETWDEIVTRNKEMHLRRYPALAEEIEKHYAFVYARKVLPSMRSMQFGGKAIEVGNQRLYNCAFVSIDHSDVFSELMFLLLSGCGVGYSVQKRHVSKLPPVQRPTKGRARRFNIGDSIEGWSDAVKVLLESYFYGKTALRFDFGAIRPAGAPLVTSGGVAPGPQPLKDALHNVEKVLLAVEPGDRLTPLQVHDICCHLADAVLAGGIRRSAMIALFDVRDEPMMSCKSSSWWDLHPQRARANNTAVLARHKADRKTFDRLWALARASGAGEPGFMWTNDADWGLNPCAEVSLRGAGQFCNLGTINAADLGPGMQEEYERRAEAVAFLCTLQAGYTDFHYLRETWQRTTEKEALIGVSMTGVAAGGVLQLDVKAAAEVVVVTNARVAKLIGIKPAGRCTVIKPEGTGSNVLSYDVYCSSGVHAYHSRFAKRRFRVGKLEPIYRYLAEHHPSLIEDDFFKPTTGAVITIPIKAPDGAITREEPATDLLARTKDLHERWIKPGHRRGANTNNVSTTVTVKEHEWDEVGDWMWRNRESYTALAVLPYDGHSYVQAPFEEITEADYDKLVKKFRLLDLSQVVEDVDLTTRQQEASCAGGLCEVDFSNRAAA